MSPESGVAEPVGSFETEGPAGSGHVTAFERLAPWMVGLGLLALGLSVWRAFPPGLWHDDGVYALLGESLKNGLGLRYTSVPGAPLAPKFPPLYPALLALWMGVTGAGPSSASLALPNLIMVALTGVLVTHVARRGMALPVKTAVAVGALAGAGFSLWRFSLVPLSEPLFLALLWAGVWAGMRLEKRPSPTSLVGFLVIAAACSYTRSVGVTLTAAVAVALLRRGNLRWAAAAVAGHVVMLAPWIVWSLRAQRALPAPLADTLGGYTPWVVGWFTEAPSRFVVGLAPAGRDLLAWFASLLAPGVSGPALWMVGLPPLAVAVWGIARMRERSWIPGLWLATTAGVLWLWPFRDARLVVPFFPVLVLGMGYAAYSGGQLRREGAATARQFGTSVLVVLALWGVAFPIQTVRLFVVGAHTEAFEARELQLAQAVQAVERVTDSTAVVGAPELWPALAIHTGRRAVPSASFKPGGTGPVWGSTVDQFTIWDVTGVDYLVLEAAGATHREALDRLDDACPGSATVVASWEGGALVHLTWTDSCREGLVQSRR